MFVFASVRATSPSCYFAIGLAGAGLVACCAWVHAIRNHSPEGSALPTITTISRLLGTYHVAGPALERPTSTATNRIDRAAISPHERRFHTATIQPELPLPASEPFGLVSERAPNGELWTKWRKVEAAIRDEMHIVTRCRASPEDCESLAALQFIAIVDAARFHAGRARLGEVNRAINLAVRYSDDVVQHGVDDHWASPLATLASGQGDCEDYAIAKFVALREAGVADEDLRIVIVRDNTLDEHHAVLAVHFDGRWIVLDNRRLALLEDNEFTHFIPLFAIDRNTGVMQFAQSVPQRRFGDGLTGKTAARYEGTRAVSTRTDAAPMRM